MEATGMGDRHIAVKKDWLTIIQKGNPVLPLWLNSRYWIGPVHCCTLPTSMEQALHNLLVVIIDACHVNNYNAIHVHMQDTYFAPGSMCPRQVSTWQIQLPLNQRSPAVQIELSAHKETGLVVLVTQPHIHSFIHPCYICIYTYLFLLN